MELSASSSSEHKEHITIITLAPLRLNKGTKNDTTLELCKFTLHSDISYPRDQFSTVSMSSTSDDSSRWSHKARFDNLWLLVNVCFLRLRCEYVEELQHSDSDELLHKKAVQALELIINLSNQILILQIKCRHLLT